MSTEQMPEEYGNGGSDNVSIGDRPAGERIDNREFRRNRHRECYCRGRNKSCPKCQGTGQLLPNWRENLQAARQSRPAGAPSPAAQGSAATLPTQPRDYRDQERPVDRDRHTSDRPSSDRPSSDRGTSDRPQNDRPQADRQQNDRQQNDRPQNDRGYDRNHDRQGGGYDRRQDRRERWQNRGGSGSGGGGGRNKGQSTRQSGKTCPMCGEFVPNLRAHVLARHDD